MACADERGTMRWRASAWIAAFVTWVVVPALTWWQLRAAIDPRYPHCGTPLVSVMLWASLLLALASTAAFVFAVVAHRKSRQARRLIGVFELAFFALGSGACLIFAATFWFSR